MLGKGLESLIPPQKGNQSQQSGGGQEPSNQPGGMPPIAQNGPISQPFSPVVPQEPVSDIGQFRPVPEEPLLPSMEPAPEEILPAPPVEEFLPPAEPELELMSEPEPEYLPEPEPEPQPQLEPEPEPEPELLAPAKIDVSSPNVEEVTAKYAVRPQPKSRGEAVFYLETEKIKPNEHQPRRHFDNEALADLAASIREFGIIQPLVVTKIETEVPNGTKVEYELIAGERRLMAAKLAGLERVPAIVRSVDVARERLELAIIENLQRENLSPIEMGRAFARLQEDFRMTQREIAARLGKSREVVANTMRLLDLPAYIQEAIEKGQVSESHGRLLLAIEDPVAQQALFHDLLNQHMTTRELRRRAAFLNKKEETSTVSSVSPEIKQFEEKLKNELGAPVSIKAAGEGGKITIDFYSKEELAQIMAKFRGEDI